MNAAGIKEKELFDFSLWKMKEEKVAQFSLAAVDEWTKKNDLWMNQQSEWRENKRRTKQLRLRGKSTNKEPIKWRARQQSFDGLCCWLWVALFLLNKWVMSRRLLCAGGLHSAASSLSAPFHLLCLHLTCPGEEEQPINFSLFD